VQAQIELLQHATLEEEVPPPAQLSSDPQPMPATGKSGINEHRQPGWSGATADGPGVSDTEDPSAEPAAAATVAENLKEAADQPIDAAAEATLDAVVPSVVSAADAAVRGLGARASAPAVIASVAEPAAAEADGALRPAAMKDRGCIQSTAVAVRDGIASDVVNFPAAHAYEKATASDATSDAAPDVSRNDTYAHEAPTPLAALPASAPRPRPPSVGQLDTVAITLPSSVMRLDEPRPAGQGQAQGPCNPPAAATKGGLAVLSPLPPRLQHFFQTENVRSVSSEPTLPLASISRQAMRPMPIPRRELPLCHWRFRRLSMSPTQPESPRGPVEELQLSSAGFSYCLSSSGSDMVCHGLEEQIAFESWQFFFSRDESAVAATTIIVSEEAAWAVALSRRPSERAEVPTVAGRLYFFRMVNGANPPGLGETDGAGSLLVLQAVPSWFLRGSTDVLLTKFCLPGIATACSELAAMQILPLGWGEPPDSAGWSYYFKCIWVRCIRLPAIVAPKSVLTRQLLRSTTPDAAHAHEKAASSNTTDTAQTASAPLARAAAPDHIHLPKQSSPSLPTIVAPLLSQGCSEAWDAAGRPYDFQVTSTLQTLVRRSPAVQVQAFGRSPSFGLRGSKSLEPKCLEQAPSSAPRPPSVCQRDTQAVTITVPLSVTRLDEPRPVRLDHAQGHSNPHAISWLAAALTRGGLAVLPPLPPLRGEGRDALGSLCCFQNIWVLCISRPSHVASSSWSVPVRLRQLQLMQPPSAVVGTQYARPLPVLGPQTAPPYQPAPWPRLPIQDHACLDLWLSCNNAVRPLLNFLYYHQLLSKDTSQRRMELCSIINEDTISPNKNRRSASNRLQAVMAGDTCFNHIPSDVQSWDRAISKELAHWCAPSCYVWFSQLSSRPLQRSQLSKLCYVHAPIILISYIRQVKGQGLKMINMMKWMLSAKLTSDLSRHIFKNKGGSSLNILERLLGSPNATISKRWSEIDEATLRRYGPALVSQFHIHPGFKEKDKFRYGDKDIPHRSLPSKNSSKHAMILVGVGSLPDSNEKAFLLQNWWKSKQFLECSQRYLESCGAIPIFVTNESRISTALPSTVCTYSEAADSDTDDTVRDIRSV
jgi:hypothetical protein